jgi:hypothetical protein
MFTNYEEDGMWKPIDRNRGIVIRENVAVGHVFIAKDAQGVACLVYQDEDHPGGEAFGHCDISRKQHYKEDGKLYDISQDELVRLCLKEGLQYLRQAYGHVDLDTIMDPPERDEDWPTL